MKIVDNRKTLKQPKPDPIEAGEILIGRGSGSHYLVLEGALTLLRINDLRVVDLRASMSLERTGIHKEDITITFEGVKEAAPFHQLFSTLLDATKN